MPALVCTCAFLKPVGAGPITRAAVPMLTPKPDRRQPSRPLDPSTCPECHAIAGPAVVRTPAAVYFRCPRCAFVWSIPKPQPLRTVCLSPRNG